MSVGSFNELRKHIGHNVVVVGYGKDELVNVAIECEDCGEVLLDFDSLEEDE